MIDLVRRYFPDRVPLALPDETQSRIEAFEHAAAMAAACNDMEDARRYMQAAARIAIQAQHQRRDDASKT